MSTTLPEVYRHDHFVARRKLFKFFGNSFRLMTSDGRLLAFSRQKAFKLREDIRVYTDESETEELLLIKADRILDFRAAYTVTDSRTGERVGALRRRGWSSMIRDSWEILDDLGTVRGRVIEDNPWKALARRFVEYASVFLPESFLIEVDGEVIGTMKHNFLGIPPKFTVDLSGDTNGRLPRPLAVATVILLLAIEESYSD